MFNVLINNGKTLSCKTCYSAFTENAIDVTDEYKSELMRSSGSKFKEEDIFDKPCIRLYIADNFASTSDKTYLAWLICNRIESANSRLREAVKDGYLIIGDSDVLIVDYENIY